MGEESDISKGPVVVWQTDKVYTNWGSGQMTSSDFSLFGTTWQLELRVSYYGRYGDDVYEVFLEKRGDKEANTPFSVITSIQTTESMECSDDFRSRSRSCKANVYSDWLCNTIWECQRKTALEEFSDFERSREWTIICVFTDIPSAMSGVFNETVEVTTRTGFDRPHLPLKNLHDLKFSSDANLDSLSEDLGKLLQDKVIPDINLRCGDRTVAAHKAILAARSPVFSAMFQSKMLESETGVIDIPDVDADVLEMFLKYVYSGRLSDLSNELLPSLYVASDKYDISALKKVCSEWMISNLSRKNCLNILLLADAHSDTDFKSAIFNFILNQMEILMSEEWKKLCKDNSALSTEVLQLVVERKWFFYLFSEEVTTQTDSDGSLVKNLHDVKQSSDANLDSLSRDLCKLLEDKVVPDVNLRCGDRTVAAHKAILAARSKVFSVMFQSKMLESETGVVDITDVDVAVLDIFLKYVYSGRLFDLSDEDLPSLYAAADKYDVSVLKSTCSERMVSNLTRENCLNILLLANTHGDREFEKAILEFILNQVDILKSEEWMIFRKENLSLSCEIYDFVVQRKLF